MGDVEDPTTRAAAALADLVHDPSIREAAVQDAVTWATQHGLVVGLPARVGAPSCAVAHAPVALLPAAYPRRAFERARAVGVDFAELVDAVTRDEEYLFELLGPVAEHDDFLARQLELARETTGHRERRGARDATLQVLRSDYMLHGPTGNLLQVEINTIASSFASLSSIVGGMHEFVLDKLLRRLEAGAGLPSGGPAEGGQPSAPPAFPRGTLARHEAPRGIARALARSVEAHGKLAAGAVPAADEAPSVVLMVVQPGELNAYDQQWLQTLLWEEHGVETVRATLAEAAAADLDERTGALRVHGRRVAVVYLRSGYSPGDYPSELEWDGRALLERSDAVKCPSITLQLAGAKKVQQDLARPGVVERFFERVVDEGAAARGDGPEAAATEPPAARSARVRQFFAGLWSLGPERDEAARLAAEEARRDPRGFVLKPQREGGGNNLYGAALVERLADPEGLEGFVLMQRIEPPPTRSVLLRLGETAQVDALSELGVYSTRIRVGDRVLLDETVGHLVRTKPATSDEGGVAAGFAVLDTPFLVED